MRFDRAAIQLGGREILLPTSFDVGRGEFVCIVGPSGCGKTNLLRVAPGLLSASAGEVRRNGRCLAQKPQLLLMDEPFGALDALARQSLQDELARLVRDEGLPVLFVTHDLEEAIYLGDRVIALQANPGPGRPSLARMIDDDRLCQ